MNPLQTSHQNQNPASVPPTTRHAAGSSLSVRGAVAEFFGDEQDEAAFDEACEICSTSPQPSPQGGEGEEPFDGEKSGNVHVTGQNPVESPRAVKPFTSIPQDTTTPVAHATRNTSDTHAEAEAVAGICREFDRLMATGAHSLRTAAASLGKPASFFSGENSFYARWQRHGVAGLLPKSREVGELKVAENAVPQWFIPAARFFYLLTNRTHVTGSMPEAVRRVISLPNLPFGWTDKMKARFLKAIGTDELPACPECLREEILARQNAGRALVPPALARRIIVNPTLVKLHRSPRDWSLNFQSAPGSQRRYSNAEGERQVMKAGDWFGGDDATPGIAVCVPGAEINTPCSQKFGVLLGRFQWLAYHDCRTDKILAWDYVVRPRSSYRAEDILNGMGAVVRTHGVPNQGWQFEGGAWNSKLVRQTIELLGCKHWRTYSPHQKAIEAIFNKVWTRLAVQFPHADMGRYRNENEANCLLYEACKAGHKDPRQYFPTLEIIVRVFSEEVAAHNTRLIVSTQYGRWVPDDLFAAAVLAAPLRQFSAEMAWMFNPFAAERTVRGMLVSVRVPMFENFSVPFDFGADWLPLYNGCKVRLHFNPREPKCVAKVVLLENCGERKAGEILGDAQLIGETAGHIRYILNWGDDNQRAGYLARQKVNNFVRRETRGVGVGGRVDYAKSEERDGLAKVTQMEKGKVGSAGETPGSTLKNLLNGDENNGSDVPALTRPVENTVTASRVHNGAPSAPQMPQDESDARPVFADRAARRAELEALEKETAHLFD